MDPNTWNMMGHRRLDWLIPSWLEDSNAFDQSEDENLSTVGYTVAFNVVVFVACILFYSSYRRVDDRVYAPKCDMMPDRTPPKLSNKNYFDWISELYNISDEVIIDKAGYDVLFLLRFYRLAFKIFAWFSIYGLCVILPINATGQSGTSSSSFDFWSMTNIVQGSPRCWFHLIGIYLLTFITITSLEREFVIYAKHRHNYLRQRHAHLRTVLVQGIPYKMRSTVTLATYFETLYPNAVLSVKLGQDVRYLDRLVQQRMDSVTVLERALYQCKELHRRPTVRVGNMMNDVDAIRYYSQQLDDLNSAVAKEQESAKTRALYADRLSDSDAFEVIEGFLQVTEIGSVKKMLKEKTGSASKWLKRKDKDSSSKSQGRSSSLLDLPSVVEAKEPEYDTTTYGSSSSYQNGTNNLSEKSSAYGGGSSGPRRLVVFKMTWKEWLWAMVNAPSFFDCWRTFKDGRLGEDHSNADGDGETAALISPPEERRMFLSKAFVTFKTFTAATIARQVIHMQLTGHMAVSEAPEPSDIAWGNLYGTRTGTFFRRFFVEAVVIFLVVAWVAPVTLVSFVVSEDALRSFFPFIDEWCDESDLFTSMIELLQPGCLVAIMNLLPPILTSLAVFEGCTSFSMNQFRTFNRYFMFQIINVFLVTTIAGSVLDCIKEIYKDPELAFSLLGESLPKMGGFFTNYLVMKAFTGLGMEIMRLPAWIVAALKIAFTSNLTPRDRNTPVLLNSIRVMSNPGWFPFAKIFAQDCLLVVVVATYACIAPLTIPAGLCYFGGASFIYKHQMLYVYEPVFETGGKWWPKVARCIVLALLFAQATMVGMMILKETYTEIYFLGAIFVATSLYFWYIVQTYVPLANHLPLDMATSIDLDQQKHPEELRGADDYIQPSLRAGAVHPEVELGVNKIDMMI